MTARLRTWTGFAQPFSGFSASLGSYFVSGNHEEFVNRTQYLDALRRAGVRVLENEKVAVDGLQIVGVPYHDLATPERFTVRFAARGSGPWRSQRPAGPRAESTVGGGIGWRLPATERAHARRAVFPVDPGGVANLREIRLWIAKARSDGGLYHLRSGHLGSASAAGHEPRGGAHSFRMKHASRRAPVQFLVREETADAGARPSFLPPPPPPTAASDQSQG